MSDNDGKIIKNVAPTTAKIGGEITASRHEQVHDDIPKVKDISLPQKKPCNYSNCSPITKANVQ